MKLLQIKTILKLNKTTARSFDNYKKNWCIVVIYMLTPMCVIHFFLNGGIY